MKLEKRVTSCVWITDFVGQTTTDYASALDRMLGSIATEAPPNQSGMWIDKHAGLALRHRPYRLSI